jgi:hypothetical protein
MKRFACCAITLALMAAALTAAPCLAQDRDGDSIPDAVECELGSDTDFAEEFTLIYHDGVIGEDDKTVSPKHKDGQDVVDVFAASVAQDRWLLKITFAADYVNEGNVFILYMDVDEDETTGRQDANTGTDLMYTGSSGTFKVSERTEGFHVGPVRMTSIGDAIYLCTDLPLSEGKLPGQLKFRFLSHVAPPGDADSDSSNWVIADLPEVRDADKPRIGPPPVLAPVAELATDRADADGDGIPDDVERALGMDPESADALHLVHDDKSADEGDQMSGNWNAAPDVTRVYFGNVAQDRWVWRIDFAGEPDILGAQVMLYLDADNDISTGRQSGAPGTDVRFISREGSFSIALNNAAVLTRDRTLRGFVDESWVYFSMDLILNHNEEGNAECRGYILSQIVGEDGDTDSTQWFALVAGGMRDLPKLRVGVMSQFLSEGVVAQKPWLGWRAQLREMSAAHLDMSEAPVEGMKHFNGAVEPTEDQASVSLTSPVAGARHINVLVQDSAIGREEVTVRVAGEQVAHIVAGQNDGDLYLFTTAEPVTLTEGAVIELVAKEPAQDFRICEVFLTPVLPEPPKLTITNLGTYVKPRALPGGSQGETVDVDVCFLTLRPVKAQVRWGAGGGLGSEATEDAATYSHRVRLTGLTRGESYSVQAFAQEGDEVAESEVLRFVADEKRLQRCGVDRAQVKLTVADAVADRPAWPVSGGIPIARGELAAASKCQLLDTGGRVVAAQFRELAYWPDGSVKWVLVSLVHEGASPDYVLEYGQAVDTPSVDGGIVVTETDDGLVIATGALEATLSREHFAPPGQVTVGGQVVISGGEGLVLVDGEGRRYTSAGAPATRFEVEESGPVRTVIRAEGPFAGSDGSFLKYRCRMYFYRGFAGIPTTVSLLAHEGESTFPPTLLPVKSLTWPMTGVADAGNSRWVQDDIDHWTLEGADREGHGPSAAGAGDLTLAVRDFWQEYPKGFALDGQTVTAEIFPELPADVYAEYTDPKLLTMNYYWFRDGNYLIASGTEPTTDVLVYLADAEVTEAWQQPPVLACVPEHYCASGAFGALEPSRPGRFEHFDEFVREGLDGLERGRQGQREYSWMNYGDSYGERGVNWTNQEYDMQWGLLVNYARTGDVAFLDRGLQAADHTVNIDMINWSARPDLLGIQKEHAPWHVGGYDTPRPEGAKYWFRTGIWNTGHVWTQGTEMAYCLTGDRRYFESIELLAEFLARTRTSFMERWMHRNYGWLTIAVLGSYNTSANPYYLNAARFFMQNVIDRIDPGTGALIHPIGECEHRPRHMGGKSFMTGVVMAGATLMDDIEPSDDLKRSITLSADWLYARMWNAEKNGFRYAQCPQFDGGGGFGTMVCQGLARACEIEDKPEYRDMLLRSMGRMIRTGSPSGSGKGYAVQIRNTPFAVSSMDRWGMDEVPIPPPTQPTVSLPPQLYLVPGRDATLGLAVRWSSPTPIGVTAEIVGLPEGLRAEAMRVESEVSRESARGPAFRISGAAKTGEAITVRWSAGKWSGEVSTVVHVREAIAVGEGIGYVGGNVGPVGTALRALGIDVQPLADLQAATLAGYRGLIIEREAHEKNLLGIRESNANLLDFIHAGGIIVLIQPQDSSWQASWLPAPLELSNASGSLDEIVAPDHPIFTTPNKIEALRGVISYDTIVTADEAWTVLATDDREQPSIVEMTDGEGRVLVVQPSPDRYVIGEAEAQAPLTVEACAQFIENLVAYLGA